MYSTQRRFQWVRWKKLISLLCWNCCSASWPVAATTPDSQIVECVPGMTRHPGDVFCCPLNKRQLVASPLQRPVVAQYFWPDLHDRFLGELFTSKLLTSRREGDIVRPVRREHRRTAQRRRPGPHLGSTSKGLENDLIRNRLARFHPAARRTPRRPRLGKRKLVAPSPSSLLITRPRGALLRFGDV